MKAKKTKHFQKDADKIEQIPEENNGHAEQIKAKKAKKNRFLACLRKTWARITGCMSCCTSIQIERSVEKLPGPSNNMGKLSDHSDLNMEELQSPCGMIMEELSTPIGNNMEDNKAKESTEIKDKNMEENQNIKTDNEEAEVVWTHSLVEIESENQRLFDLHSQEELYIQNYTSQEADMSDKEIEAENQRLLEAENQCLLEAENQHLFDLHSQEELYIQNYTSQEADVSDKEVETEYQRFLEAEYQRLFEAECQHLFDLMHSQEELDVQCYASHEAEVVVTDNFVEAEYQHFLEESEYSLREAEEYQRPHTQIHSQEDVHILNYTSQEKILAENDHIHDQIQIKEDLCYDAEDEKQQDVAEYDQIHNQIQITENLYYDEQQQDGEKLVPLTLECFTLHSKLGEGSYGEVLLATDIIRKECVAIKVIHKCSFTEYEEIFTELNILKLSHESPFLIHGLAAFHTEKCVYYVQELAPRGDLFNFIYDNFPLDTPTIQFMTAELICGIQFMHKKNIIHRDLKPQNILLTADGHVKITDFGLALMGVHERTTEDAKGTHPYVAPEMWRRQEYGRGVDFFALGVIMYEMYTNEFPFPGETKKEYCRSILKKTPFYPAFLAPETVDILQGLMCKYQDYRLGVLGDIRKHPFFSGINWEDVESRRMEPSEAIMDIVFFNLDVNKTLDYMEKEIHIELEDHKILKEFNFVCPDWSQNYHPVNNEAI